MSTFPSVMISVAGWIGAAATLGAYFLVSQRRIEPDSMTFQGMNLLGATLLGVSATVNGAWPSAAVNYIWILIGLQAIVSARHMFKLAVTRVLYRMQTKARQQRLRVQQRVELLPHRGRRGPVGRRPVTVEEISAAVTAGATTPRATDQEYSTA